ncbi:hypothetical protein GWI33_015145 [Rhynchophorus ferrugineus]|uniref:Uncharacterized protein n=1 Tax=Rhynchophorus ferrugineus TaxID=354439 RepID=A0A834I343_RHYFE|nr:hypothetical protein GWI33_015145 [Rhynchophorus ferrugineus]
MKPSPYRCRSLASHDPAGPIQTERHLERDDAANDRREGDARGEGCCCVRAIRIWMKLAANLIPAESPTSLISNGNLPTSSGPRVAAMGRRGRVASRRQKGGPGGEPTPYASRKLNFEGARSVVETARRVGLIAHLRNKNSKHRSREKGGVYERDDVVDSAFLVHKTLQSKNAMGTNYFCQTGDEAGRYSVDSASDCQKERDNETAAAPPPLDAIICHPPPLDVSEEAS